MSKSMFGRDLRNVVSNDIGFDINVAKAIVRALIEEEGGLEPGKLPAGDARGATFCKP